MAKASEALLTEAGPLEALGAVVAKAGSGRPPIHLWNPPFCGEIDMRIARDGTWFYQGTPIGRPAMVRLFASVLRREDDRHVLVTPVEKVGIKVEDAPFVAVELAVGLEVGHPILRLRTNVDDWVTVDADHPLRFEPGAAEGMKPYVLVRDDLWALVSRALFYDLVERGEVRQCEGLEMFGVASSGSFFPMAPANAIGFNA
ncbi:DUF1285 domain-containing protein [Lichenifustis flavocetrariae]|uniref:DUF1285 domain-containing protein n=1 Tax=Lichenifustis flavocetrariae TaxID=2949735 RepID=A0AA41YT67_9HYPH|nr:DUF1285 domain-containing protein [Lichenifustis flavocetrariae]MCW6508136.1 DUF1285 domain-containing protein [Lichenifustis flavocetrariae]